MCLHWAVSQKTSLYWQIMKQRLIKINSVECAKIKRPRNFDDRPEIRVIATRIRDKKASYYNRSKISYPLKFYHFFC